MEVVVPTGSAGAGRRPSCSSGVLFAAALERRELHRRIAIHVPQLGASLVLSLVGTTVVSAGDCDRCISYPMRRSQNK